MRRVTSSDGLLAELRSDGYDFFTGVPSSGLSAFISDLVAAPDGQHVPATWEAEAIALAAGAWLGGRKPCVYLQNAGLGHAVNPLTSLCLPYGIDMLLVVEHRHTLPQHAVMGQIDQSLLELLGWSQALFVDGDNNES